MRIKALPIIMAIVASPALAGDNSCFGTLVVGNEQSAIVEVHPPLPPSPSQTSICMFDNNSEVGHQILRVCKHNQLCQIEMPLSQEVKRKDWSASTRRTSSGWPPDGFITLTKIKEKVTRVQLQ